MYSVDNTVLCVIGRMMTFKRFSTSGRQQYRFRRVARSSWSNTARVSVDDLARKLVLAFGMGCACCHRSEIAALLPRFVSALRFILCSSRVSFSRSLPCFISFPSLCSCLLWLRVSVLDTGTGCCGGSVGVTWCHKLAILCRFAGKKKCDGLWRADGQVHRCSGAKRTASCLDDRLRSVS